MRNAFLERVQYLRDAEHEATLMDRAVQVARYAREEAGYRDEDDLRADMTRHVGPARRERLRRMLERYSRGLTINDVMREMELTRGSAQQLLLRACRGGLMRRISFGLYGRGES